MSRAASPLPSARINWLRRVISRAARRVAAVQDQMCHSVGKRLGLAAAGAGGDQQCRRRCGMVADPIFDSAALFWIEAVQMSRAIERLQLGVPFPFTLGDSIGATASQCLWPGRGKRGLRHCPERTLDRFAAWPLSESPFRRCLPSAIGAAPRDRTSCGLPTSLMCRRWRASSISPSCSTPGAARSSAGRWRTTCALGAALLIVTTGYQGVRCATLVPP
jgi:hypothetical protein